EKAIPTFLPTGTCCKIVALSVIANPNIYEKDPVEAVSRILNGGYCSTIHGAFFGKKSINSLVLMAIYYLKKNMGLSASFID
ncbi:hypothetical protein, partial [Klebsiella pneumoniae]